MRKERAAVTRKEKGEQLDHDTEYSTKQERGASGYPLSQEDSLNSGKKKKTGKGKSQA